MARPLQKLPLLLLWFAASGITQAWGEGGCLFPVSWSGKWFQSGIQHLININTTSIETKGVCVESSGDKFIMEDRAENCFRCIFITENHPNVLQYKETYCGEQDTLDNMCNLISGDASLYLMFRDVPLRGPEPCPFKGAPFTFTYNRGNGECASPVSRIDSCIQDSRLRIHYQACPDVHGTESTVDELACLASWKEGSMRYLIGKINGQRTSDEDRYRCFMYEDYKHNNRTGYYVAQSGDATCSGLSSPQEGARTMKLAKADAQHPRCRYPTWATEHHQWHALDSSTTYHFTQMNATLRITHAGNGSSEMRVVCHSIESNGEGEVRLVAHATRGCDSGYICMVFYRRDGHVIELQQSNVTSQVSEEACNPRVFKQNKTPFTTLVTVSLRPRKCPYLGRYSLSGGSLLVERRRRTTDDSTTDGGCDSRNYRSLLVGCSDSSDKMEFYSACSDTEPDLYSCHASWEVNGTSYLIASPASRSSGSARRYCFIYSHREGITEEKHRIPSRLTGVTESCRRNLESPESRGIFQYNLTQFGQCTQASTGAVSATAVVLPSVFFILLLVATLLHLR